MKKKGFYKEKQKLVVSKMFLNSLETNKKKKSMLVKSTNDAKNKQVNIKGRAVIRVNTNCLISWQYSGKINIAECCVICNDHLPKIKGQIPEREQGEIYTVLTSQCEQPP